MTHDGQPTVLVADDDQMVLDTYEMWLEQEYTPRTATDGNEALAAMNESVDVIILDRLMPELSGDEALTELRDQGYTCPVGMITAVDPDFDIIELPFEAYQTKPISRDEFLGMIEQLLSFGNYEAAMQRLISLAEKRAALEGELSEAELQRSDKYQTLCEEYETVSAETDEQMEALNKETFSNVFASFE